MSTALEQLQKFLSHLFQYESADLDFGIYKILHYKRAEIRDFIHRLLVEKVREQLATLDAQLVDRLQEERDALAAQPLVATYLSLKETQPETARTLRTTPASAGEIGRFENLEAELAAARRATRSEEEIYNHLYLFFSRYYDKGDFISRRRFGRSEKYVVPYNGEETHFHWANHDQYYIKSSEYFQQFLFKAPHLGGLLTVQFKLAAADGPQGNVKADEARYFLPAADKESTLEDDVLTVWFHFRALTEEEKSQYSGNSKQDAIDEATAAALQERWHHAPETVNLWKVDEEGGPNLLLKKLRHYTRKNSYDFFIHKDLRGFLSRELDFYIKSELVKVDDLYVLDTDAHYEAIRQSFKTIKAFKAIADTIITFIAQIEDFQKALWEKKKFVLDTQYIVTLEKLAAWLEEEDFRRIAERATGNEAQVAAWKVLFGTDGAQAPDWSELTVDSLQWPADGTMGPGGEAVVRWRPLPVDTRHFDAAFKTELLALLSRKISLEEELDGLVLHSDNYHGLQLLEEGWKEGVKCVYIDPPYNTVENGFLYKNSYQHSSWNSMMATLVGNAMRHLSQDGVLNCAIDDFELNNLDSILLKLFGEERCLGRLIVEIKPSGRTNDEYFSTSHEYYVCYGKEDSTAVINFFPLTEEVRQQYAEGEGEEAYKWRDFLRTGGYSTPAERPNSHYPIYYLPSSAEGSLIPQDGAIEIWPIDSEGKSRVWRKTPPSFEKHLQAGEIKFHQNRNGDWKVQIIDRVKTGTRPKSVWVGKKYDAASHGTKLLKKMFGAKPFSFPKSVFAVKDVLYTAVGEEDDNIILDFFAGSGTTFHATQLLNKDDNGRRKCILIEQGPYVHTVILPRIQKIAYAYDWRDGKPQSDDGLGIFLKYQRLEQYEEALENIAITDGQASPQAALAFDRYVPKYMLQMEARGSRTLVNAADMQNPWGYMLKVWNGCTYEEEWAADLPETFAYLAGLHTIGMWEEMHGGRRYLFQKGRSRDGRTALCAWRDVTGWAEADYATDRGIIEAITAAHPTDVLYTNGDCSVPGARSIEEVFLTRMVPTV